MGKKWRDVRVGDMLVTGKKKKGRVSYYPITQEEKEIGEKQGKKLSTDGSKKREEKEGSCPGTPCMHRATSCGVRQAK